jgi:hypothetical protein
MSLRANDFSLTYGLQKTRGPSGTLSSLNHCFQYRRNITTSIFGWLYRQSNLPSRFRFMMTRLAPVLSGAKILWRVSVRTARHV